MGSHSKATLKSKLTVFLVCYREAERRKDQQRMDKLEALISDLREEIDSLEQ